MLSIILLLLALSAFLIFGSGTPFSSPKQDLYIRTGSSYESLLNQLHAEKLVRFPWVFDQLARRAGYPQRIKAGKYEIKSGTSLFNLLRMLKNGRQVPVNLVITKLRTKEDLAALVGRKLECDSVSFIAFLNNPDTLKAYGLDTNTVMTAVMPNTYTYFWNIGPSRVFRKIESASRAYWTPERRQEAAAHRLNPVSAYILASIVEEETNRAEDKPKIASVYLNRLDKGMKLAADPTVKFAMRNFELKRVYAKYLQTESPYNTYRYAGLPPGPICTPSAESLEAVLQAPETKYLYFVAKPDFSGYSNFAETFTEHLANARAYQKALDEQIRISQQSNATP